MSAPPFAGPSRAAEREGSRGRASGDGPVARPLTPRTYQLMMQPPSIACVTEAGSTAIQLIRQPRTSELSA